MNKGKDNTSKLKIALEKHIEIYSDLEKLTVEDAQQAIIDFDNNWAYHCYKFSQYCTALNILSDAYFELPKQKIKAEDINHLSELINFYHCYVNKQSAYNYSRNYHMYVNLGFCWLKLGEKYKEEALESLKKFIYYYYKEDLSNYYPKTDSLFAFRKCNIFLYKALINDKLYLSSPTTFNDPFECPHIEEMHDKYTSHALVYQAYKDCLKFACFIQPDAKYYRENKHYSRTIYNNKRNNKESKVLGNNLMWAHYADSHKGICIKYNANKLINKLNYNDGNIVSNFKMIIYSKKSINEPPYYNLSWSDTFFVKGIEWQYENELRYLYYNMNDTGEHKAIDIEGCIEAIYFGLKCSKEDKETILNIFKSKKSIIKDHNEMKNNTTIHFYQMEIDKESLGQVKAVEIT